MARGRFEMNLAGAVSKNRAAVNAAMKRMAPIIRQQILANTSPLRGGHLHKSGDMRNTLKVWSVGGRNPRIMVSTLDYGVHQDQGFTHYQSGEFIHNPWITPVIKGRRNDIVRGIAILTRRFLETGRATFPRNRKT